MSLGTGFVGFGGSPYSVMGGPSSFPYVSGAVAGGGDIPSCGFGECGEQPRASDPGTMDQVREWLGDAAGWIADNVFGRDENEGPQYGREGDQNVTEDSSGRRSAGGLVDDIKDYLRSILVGGYSGARAASGAGAQAAQNTSFAAFTNPLVILGGFLLVIILLRKS